MRLPLALLLALSALAVACPSSTNAAHQHGEESYMPSQCPFVNTTTGLRCLGIPLPNGVTVAGYKYRCSNGHHWVESR